jgi:hypothetical protein
VLRPVLVFRGDMKLPADYQKREQAQVFFAFHYLRCEAGKKLTENMFHVRRWCAEELKRLKRSTENFNPAILLIRGKGANEEINDTYQTVGGSSRPN